MTASWQPLTGRGFDVTLCLQLRIIGPQTFMSLPWVARISRAELHRTRWQCKPATFVGVDVKFDYPNLAASMLSLDGSCQYSLVDVSWVLPRILQWASVCEQLPDDMKACAFFERLWSMQGSCSVCSRHNLIGIMMLTQECACVCWCSFILL